MPICKAAFRIMPQYPQLGSWVGPGYGSGHMTMMRRACSCETDLVTFTILVAKRFV